jgi:hypothetical protein
MFSDPPEGFVTSAVACQHLGISDRTLRRRVQAGTIEGEYIPRPQGTVLYVRLPEGLAAVEAALDGTVDAPTEAATSAGGKDTALLLAALLERLDGKDAALLAATERAARAEAERDAARQAAAGLAERLSRVETERDAERRRGWWAKLIGRPPA